MAKITGWIRTRHGTVIGVKLSDGSTYMYPVEF
jgi:hypothetical protein